MILPGAQEGVSYQEPSQTATLLTQIARNQVAQQQALQGIMQVLEMQFRVQVGADTKALWKLKYLESEKAAEALASEAVKAAARIEAATLAEQAASGADVDDVGVRSDESDAVKE